MALCNLVQIAVRQAMAQQLVKEEADNQDLEP